MNLFKSAVWDNIVNRVNEFTTGPSVYVDQIKNAANAASVASVAANKPNSVDSRSSDADSKSNIAVNKIVEPLKPSHWTSPFWQMPHDFLIVKNGPAEPDLHFYNAGQQRCIAYFSQEKPLREYDMIRLKGLLLSRPIPVVACIIRQNIKAIDNYVVEDIMGCARKECTQSSFSNVVWEIIGERSIPFLCLFAEEHYSPNDHFFAIQFACSLSSCVAAADLQKAHKAASNYRATLKGRCDKIRNSIIDVLKGLNQLDIVEIDASETNTPLGAPIIQNIPARPDNLADNPCYVTNREFPIKEVPAAASSYMLPSSYLSKFTSYLPKSYGTGYYDRRPTSHFPDIKNEREYKVPVAVGEDTQLPADLIAAYETKDYIGMWAIRYKARNAFTAAYEKKIATNAPIPKISLSRVFQQLKARLAGSQCQSMYSLLHDLVLLPWDLYEFDGTEHQLHRDIKARFTNATGEKIWCHVMLANFMADYREQDIKCSVTDNTNIYNKVLDWALIDFLKTRITELKKVNVKHDDMSDVRCYNVAGDVKHESVVNDIVEIDISMMSISDSVAPQLAPAPKPLSYEPINITHVPNASVDASSPIAAPKTSTFCDTLMRSTSPIEDIIAHLSLNTAALSRILALDWTQKFVTADNDIELLRGPLEVTLNTGYALRTDTEIKLLTVKIADNTDNGYQTMRGVSDMLATDIKERFDRAVAWENSPPPLATPDTTPISAFCPMGKLSPWNTISTPTIMSIRTLEKINPLVTTLVNLSWGLIKDSTFNDLEFYAPDDLNNPLCKLIWLGSKLDDLKAPLNVIVLRSNRRVVQDSYSLAEFIINKLRDILDDIDKDSSIADSQAGASISKALVAVADEASTILDVRSIIDQSFYAGTNATRQIMDRIGKLLKNYRWNSWVVKPNGNMVFKNTKAQFTLLVSKLNRRGQNIISDLKLCCRSNNVDSNTIIVPFYETVFEIFADYWQYEN